jgi:uncharacterized protein YifE (UPF0438 family)
MPNISVSVNVPLSIELEVEHGERIIDAIEKYVNNRIPSGWDKDGEVTVYEIECAEIDHLEEGDTVYSCECCKEWTKNVIDGLCAACRNEQTEAQEIEKANQRFVQRAEALKSRIVSSDDYLETFCVTAYAAKTTNKE